MASKLAEQLDTERKRTHAEVGTAISGLKRVATELDLLATTKDLQQAGLSLKLDTFKLIVAGRGYEHDGHSTIFNALLGQATHPVPDAGGARIPLQDYWPFRARTLLNICYKEQPTVRLRRFDGSHEDWTFQRYLRAPVDFDEEPIASHEAIRDFWLGFPAELCKAGVTMVYSPALDNFLERAAAMQEAVKGCDAAIIVFRIDDLAGQSQREFIREHIVPTGTKIFTIVNPRDSGAASPRLLAFAWDRLVTQVRGGPEYAGQSVEDFARLHDTFFIDARSAEAGRFSGDAALLAASGFEVFEQRLGDFLLHERAGVHLRGVVQSGEIAARALAQEIERRSAALRPDATPGPDAAPQPSAGKRKRKSDRGAEQQDVPDAELAKLLQFRQEVDAYLQVLSAVQGAGRRQPAPDPDGAQGQQTTMRTDPGPDSKVEAALQAWRAAVERVAALAAATHAPAARQLDAILARFEATPGVVAFGGHFSSGKSTVINALLGRDLLPTSDYPETGAICVLQAGPLDHAELSFRTPPGSARARNRAGAQAETPRALPCTREAIERAVSLIDQHGATTVATGAVDRLHLTLAGAPIPEGMRWIDSPGINDTAAMSERASVAARDADILIWVLNSRQLLAETEVAFLEQHIARFGAASVVFLVNAFLGDREREENTADWRAFTADALPRHRDKLRSRAPSMGYQPGARPELVVVSARALCSGKTSGFGGPQLRRLLSELDTPTCPRIRKARRSTVRQPCSNSPPNWRPMSRPGKTAWRRSNGPGRSGNAKRSNCNCRSETTFVRMSANSSATGKRRPTKLRCRLPRRSLAVTSPMAARSTAGSRTPHWTSRHSEQPPRCFRG